MMLAWVAHLAVAAECPEEPVVAAQGQTVSVTFCPTAVGCQDGCFAGVTLRRASDAMHYDMEAVPLTAEQLGKPVRVSGTVGSGFVQYVAGVWEDKATCSDNPRHGCQAYGYVLNDAIWAYPNGAFEYWEMHPFVDFEPPRVQVLEAGGGSTLAWEVRTLLQADHEVVEGTANNQRTEIQVLYRARWDRPRAWKIANTLREARLGYRWTVSQWADAPEAFVVAVGGE